MYVVKMYIYKITKLSIQTNCETSTRRILRTRFITSIHFIRRWSGRCYWAYCDGQKSLNSLPEFISCNQVKKKHQLIT